MTPTKIRNVWPLFVQETAQFVVLIPSLSLSTSPFTGVFIVMECCKGGDLLTALTNDIRFSLPRTASVMKQLATAVKVRFVLAEVLDARIFEFDFHPSHRRLFIHGCVQGLHAKNLVHRDLKLENILFVSEAHDSEIRLADFGLAKNNKGQSLMVHS